MAMMMKLTLFVHLVTSVLDGRVSAFILDSQSCLAYPPCTCSGSFVRCDSKGLDTLPRLYPSNVTGGSIYLYMSSNSITSTPADSFSNLTVSNNTKIDLRLYDNHINSIATNGFRGIRDARLDIDLHDNYLTTIPSELTTLTHVEKLDLQGNPIASLNPTTMHQLGKSLTDFRIDLIHFNGIPIELNQLKSLEGLYIRYLNSTHLDFDVFDKFADSLRTLDIQYSKLDKIPAAICHLHNLQALTFSNNNNLHTNSTLLEPCGKTLTSVSYVAMFDNKLTHMPDVFRSFPSMRTLELLRNNIAFIHWDTVTLNSTLTYLYLNYNDLTRIPSAVGKLHALDQLTLAGNHITSVEDDDLRNLHRLDFLDLSGNPLVYISPNAFTNNAKLTALHVFGTQLRHLPRSLALTHLVYLFLSNTPIECDCDLSFMKSLDITNSKITGTCSSGIISIKTYLTDDLQNCH